MAKSPPSKSFVSNTTLQRESPRLELDANGIAWITFDDAGSSVNVLSAATMGELDRIADSLWNQRPAGLVLISAKPGVFLAGADIYELAAIRDAQHAYELSRAGQQVFNKIEELGVPTVAAIDGACLGGGLELALVCRWRVATDDPRTRLGFPETQLGIIPGWGGTQRLPRVIGMRRALELIAPGKMIDATQALRLGLVDDVAPPVVLRERALAWALGKLTRRRRKLFILNLWPVKALVGDLARRETRKRTRGLYPAPLQAIEAVQSGLGGDMHRAGLEREARLFSELAATETVRNLTRVFFLREKYSKLVAPVGSGSVSTAKSPVIGKVGVIGAGVMGAGIAHWCGARGLTVRLKEVSPELAAAGMKRIAQVYAEGVQRGKLTALEAAHGLARVHPTTDDSGFGNCDLIVEAVREKLEVKKAVYGQLKAVVKRGAIMASNTSAIPIDELARAWGRPERFVGLHFFNPVHRMPLVEVVRGEKTSDETLVAAVGFVKQLKKIPVIVKGTPGFLVNRLLMPYLNEAGRLFEEGVAVETIDNAMLEYGMPMGPLRLLDEIGIDVAFEVGSELAAAYQDRMRMAGILGKLHAAGFKGRKGGAGFYVFAKGKSKPNPKLREWAGESALTMSSDKLQERLLVVMFQEARRCLDEGVVESADDIDAAMIFGTGFPPFRGGLMRACGLGKSALERTAQ